MTWTSKVSNVLKSNAKSFIGNKISNAAGNLLSNFASGSSTAKLAAKLVNKSPLDIDQSPTSHLSAQNDPFKYGQLYYPEETQNLGEGHYIIFDIIMNERTILNAYNNENTKVSQIVRNSISTRLGERQQQAEAKRFSQLKKQGYLNKDAQTISQPTKSGMGKDIQTHTYLGDSIILYTPATVKFDYKATYDQAETKNIALLSETGKQLFKNIEQFMSPGSQNQGDMSGLGDMLNTLKDAGGVLGRQIVQSALEVTFPGAAGFFTKQSGRAVNPRMELAFQSVPFRSFAFDFDFAPKNLKEVQMVNKMMQLFKFHMLPDVSDEKYLITPSEFQISYYYRDRANMYIPKISRCVLTDMSIDYSPEGVFHTFKADDKGAMPVISNMKLTFSETEIMTKQTTADGF
jgi:hypothetical protein